MFAVDLGERDERPPILWPTLQLGQLVQCRLAFDDWSLSNFFDSHRPQSAGQIPIPKRVPCQLPRIDLQFYEMPHGLQSITKQKPRPVERAKQVRNHRKSTVLDVFKQQSRAARGVDPPLNGRSLQTRINFRSDPDEKLVILEIGDTLLQATVTH